MARGAATTEDLSDEQARQQQIARTSVHVGRGGAGNVRSPSRDPTERRRQETAENESLEQQRYLQQQEVQHQVSATGRGGLGNIPSAPAQQASVQDRGRSATRAGGVSGVLRSLSRSRSRDTTSERARSESRGPRSTSRARHPLNQVDEVPSTESEGETVA